MKKKILILFLLILSFKMMGQTEINYQIGNYKNEETLKDIKTYISKLPNDIGKASKFITYIIIHKQ